MPSREPPENGRLPGIGDPGADSLADDAGAVGSARWVAGGRSIGHATTTGVALDDLDDAIDGLRRAAESRPDDAVAQTRWAEALFDLAQQGRRGAEREARERVGRALVLQPDLPDALLVRARFHARDGDWAGTIEAVRRAGTGGGDPAERAAVALLGWSRGLADRGEWLAAFPLWREAAALAPERARPELVEILRAEQDVLLAPSRWSWLVRPPEPDPARSRRYAAAGFVAAVANLTLFVVLASRDATLVLSLLPCLGIVVAPAGLWWFGRRRLRERAAPHSAVIAGIRADPARVFRGEPPLDLVLAALEYVAIERQGAAIVGRNPWLLGRGSPSERWARRGALLRAPWMPRGDEPAGPPRR